MKRTIVRMVSTFLILLLASQAVAAPRAFKAEASGWLDTYGEHVMFTGGKGTHFGQMLTMDASLQDTLPDVLLLPGFIGLYTAKGDAIYMQMTGPADLDPVTGIGFGTLSIVGGTGRFENATGSVDMMFHLNLDDPGLPFFELVMDGSIDY